MEADSKRHYHRRKYVARKDSKEPRAPYWEVGIQTDNTGDDGGFKKAIYGHWTPFQANEMAEALNKAVDDFIELNDLSKFDEPLIQRRLGDPNDPTNETTPTDRLARWLTATDILIEDWTGSLIEEIKRIRAVIEERLHNAKNVDVVRDSDGSWRIYLKEKKGK
jgi:hypothetical protein